jgi:tetratricopeptide (TPR) repeat protein
MRLNVKALVILVASAVLLGGTVFGVHYLQAARIADALLWQAQRAEAENRPEQVVRYLSRYLEFVPGDTEQRAVLGRTLASPRMATNWKVKQQALFVLDQALSRDGDREDLRRLLVPIAMELKRMDLAEEHLKKLRKTAPADGEVEYLYGQWHDAQNHYSDAARCYRKAIELSPQRMASYLRLAELLRRQVDPVRHAELAAEARRVLDDLVANNPNSYEAYLARWRHHLAAGLTKGSPNLAEAAKDVTRAVELAPDQADVILAGAELARTREDLIAAREQLQRGLKQSPHDVRFHQAMIALELHQGRRLEAVATARQGVKAVTGKDQVTLLWSLANLLIDSGENAEADRVIAEIDRAHTSPASVDYLRARRQLQQGQWVEAARLFERTRGQLANLADVPRELLRQVDLFLGQCYDQLDEPGLRSVAFSRVLEQDANSVTARLGKAEAQAALGRLDDALDQYRKLMELPDAPGDGWVEVARLTLLRNLQREQPDWREVDAALDKAAKAKPNAPDIVLLRAEALMAQDQPDRAEELLSRARDQEPKQTAFWTALASLAERRKQPELAWQLLRQAEEKAGDSVALRLARAGYWLERRTPDARAALDKLQDGMDRFTLEDQSRLLRGLAEALYQLGETKQAAAVWTQLSGLPRHKNDLRLRLLCFHLALQSDDKAGVERILAEIHQIEGGKGTFWRYCEALRLIEVARQGDRGVLDAARAHLDAVAARRPAWTAVLLAKADLENLRGNTDQAIASYHKAIELGERSPRTVRQLVVLLHKRQRFDEADQEIRQLQKQEQLSAELKRLAADVSLRNRDPLRAVEMALQAVSNDSTDYRDHLWLGQILASAGQRLPEAEQHLRKAVALDQRAADAWVALVRFLAGRGQLPEAEKAIEEARAKLSAQEAPLAVAQCFDATGRLEQAKEQFRAALAARPDDPLVLRSFAAFSLRTGESKEAESCLRRVLEPGVKASADDRAWARRGLALVLAARASDHRGFLEALQLAGLVVEGGKIKEAKSRAGEFPEEYRTRARLLATQKSRTMRDKAVSYLEELGRREPLTADDQFLLAQLYDANGVWTKARELLRNLTTAQKEQASFFAYFGRSLIRQREFEEASRCIEQLERLETAQKLEPGAHGSVELKAMALDVRGQSDKAVELLKSRAERPGAKPEETLVLAGYLARQGKLSEALDWCERATNTCPSETVAAILVALLRTAPPKPEDAARVERWLRAALEKKPDSAALLLHLSDLRDIQGQFQDVEGLCRQVLDRDSKNLVALNNLAWMLALRSGKGDEALALIDRAIEQAGPLAGLLDTRAVVYLALGQTDRAIVDLEEATAEEPTAARLFHLARAYRQANNTKAASRALRQAKLMKLQPEQLHPVERATLQQLSQELDVR